MLTHRGTGNRWHLDARSHWPTKRFIPDLQEKGPHRAKVQCLLFNCFPANAHLGFRFSLLPVPLKPCEFIDTGMWQGFVCKSSNPPAAGVMCSSSLTDCL